MLHAHKHTSTTVGKHLPPFFFNTAYLCPSVILLLLWLLLFIVSHAISAVHLAFAFEHLLCVLPQSLASVSVHVCICLVFYVCLFVISFLSFFLTTPSKCKPCQAKDQSVADAHTGDVSADLCLRVRWQLSVSVTCWFILLSSVLIPPPLTPPLHPSPPWP